jgi:hypothetical protein
MNPDIQQKTDYLNEHFVYEAQELVSCGLFHASILKHTRAMRERMLYEVFVNISLDHTLLHARNLLEFPFYKEDGDGKYARAVSYVTDWVRPPMTPNLSLLERRVNDEITHLGWNRLNVRPEEKS